jgi:hypothetical protein
MEKIEKAFDPAKPDVYRYCFLEPIAQDNQ